ncbi:MAG: hypothetical protein J7J34_00805 [Thermoplasmata archaeon]|nr:hypothetical protein [Thermoplasmata archaeon]
MIKREFMRDRRGISIMQDAVLFCVMVSLSGVVLMPAFTSNAVQKAYIEKENEEKAEEILHKFMTCKVDEFEHLNAENILDRAGINASYGLLKPLVDGMLEKEEMHRTYADLCTECMACQLRFSGRQLNVLTENFTEMTEAKLGEFMDEQLGSRYSYNFTIVWNPIAGFDFGGELSTGDVIPSDADVYTAIAYATMPSSLFTKDVSVLLENMRNYIENSVSKNDYVSDFRDGQISEEEFKQHLTEFLVNLIDDIIWRGFDNGSSILDVSIDYIFQGVKNAIEDAFDDALNMTAITIMEAAGENFSEMVARLMKDSFCQIFPVINASLPMKKLISEVKESIKEQAKNFVNETIKKRVTAMVENVASNINKFTNIRAEIINWLLQQINFCRAKVMLSIWEV